MDGNSTGTSLSPQERQQILEDGIDAQITAGGRYKFARALFSPSSHSLFFPSSPFRTCIFSVESLQKFYISEAKMSTQDVAEQNIQMWKVKKLIKSLDSARG